MANASILSAFERMWQHVVAALGNKANVSDITDMQAEIDTKVPISRAINGKALSTNISLSASDVGAEASGSISSHNTNTSAHNDIRGLISDLSTQVNNFLDVDDITRDELSEVLTLIDNNRGDLESLTTNKINVFDIVDNVTTASTTKVLSANQGVELDMKIRTHINDNDNPHDVTLSQLGVSATATELNYIDGVTSNIQTQLNSKASSSHGNHVPETETANNARFLRNDNTWQTVTPSNIGLSSETWTFTLENGSKVTKKVYVG